MKIMTSALNSETENSADSSCHLKCGSICSLELKIVWDGRASDSLFS